MCWNFAYDFIRQWILNDIPNRREPFNKALTANPRYTDVVNYEDFFEQQHPPDEFVVIEAMRNANLINGKVFGKLVERLRERNQYAHPNDTVPTMNMVNGYIDHLITLILVAPFRPQGLPPKLARQ